MGEIAAGSREQSEVGREHDLRARYLGCFSHVEGAPVSKPVLLVEGNPDDERSALYALKKNGLGEEEVAVVRDVSEALEYLFDARAGRGADGLPGLVLLDQRLPGVDGPEVIRHLRADDRTASLPVVVLTAGDLPETPDDYGAWAFIRKPLTPEKLAEAARKLEVRALSPERRRHGKGRP